MSTPLTLKYNFPPNFTMTKLPVLPTGNITNIDWGDGIQNTILSHTFSTGGIYIIKIYGSDITNMTQTDIDQSDEKNTSARYLTQCIDFGTIGLINLDYAFKNCSMLTSVPITLPPNVNSMASMFNGALLFNYDISQWEVSEVTDMSGMFSQASNFNSDISLWDVSKVSNMSSMFSNTKLSIDNYDKLLNAWSKLTLQPNVLFLSNLMYSKVGEPGRNKLIQAPNNWIMAEDLLVPNVIYQNTNFNITYNNTFTLGTTYYLSINSKVVSSVIYNSTTSFITFVNINIPTSGNLLITISYNPILFTNYLTIVQNCLTEKPKYSFSEQLSSSDRMKRLKSQTIYANLKSKNKTPNYNVCQTIPLQTITYSTTSNSSEDDYQPYINQIVPYTSLDLVPYALPVNLNNTQYYLQLFNNIE